MCQKESLINIRFSRLDMTETTVFRDFVGDYPGTRLLEFLIEGRFFDYTLTDISEKAGVSWRTLNRIWPKFVKKEIVIITRTIGRIKLYKLNMENPVVVKLVELFDSLLDQSVPVEKIKA
jgi:hypothetical protein